MAQRFAALAARVAHAAGSYRTFLLALALILGWAFSGPLFGFSTTWQLVVNTATTIVTFLMVFLIQNTQNRDSLAMHLKLDELLRAVEGARSSLIDAEDEPDAALAELKAEYTDLRAEHEALEDEHEELEAEHDALARRVRGNGRASDGRS
jgi:low affinity Fe/Cu permease